MRGTRTSTARLLGAALLLLAAAASRADDEVESRVVVRDLAARPVAGATVHVAAVEEGRAHRVVGTTTSGADGTATLRGAGRDRVVVVTAPGRGRFAWSADPVREPLRRVVHLRPGHALRGRVLGPGDAPMSGVVVEDRETDVRVGFERIEVLRSRAPVAEDGSFALEGLAEGRADLVVRVPGGGSFAGPWVAVPGVREIDLRLPATCPLEGVVVAEEDGRPLAGATVHVRSLEGVAFWTDLRTDAQGRFRSPAVSLDVLRVVASAEDRLADGVEGLLPEGEGFAPVTIALARGAVVRGRVTAAGKPLAGASVRVDPEDGPARRTTTDADGRWRLGGFATGPVEVDFRKPGFEWDVPPPEPFAKDPAPHPSRLRLVEGEETVLDTVLVAQPVVELRGRVEGPSGPVAGAVVAAGVLAGGELRTTSDAAGRFTIRVRHDVVLGAGLWAAAEGFESEYESFHPDEKGAWPEAVIRLRPPAVVRGRVRTADGTPLRNARVSVVSDAAFGDWGDDHPVRADGTFEVPLDGLRDGFRILAEDSGHVAAEGSAREDGDERSFRAEITLRRPFVVRGRVLRRNAPVPRARILRERSSLVLATTDAEGRFAIADLPPRDEDEGGLVARVPGHEDVSLAAGVGDAGGELVVDVDPPGAVEVVVVDEAGAPVASAEVVVREADVGPLVERPSRMPGLFGATTAIGIGGREGAATDAAGRVRAMGLPVVPHDVQVAPPEGDARGLVSAQVAGVLPAEDGATLVRVVLREGLTLGGRVLDAEGRPVAGATVTVPGGPGRPGAEGTSGPDGAFSVGGLDENARRVVVHPPRGASLLRAIVPDVQPGGPPVEFRLRPWPTLSGRVLDERGAPAAGVRVVARPAQGGVSLHERERLAAVTGPDGAFALRVDREEPWRLAHDDETSRARDLLGGDEVAADASGLVLRSVPLPLVTGRVTTADGKPVAGATVLVGAPDDPEHRRNLVFTREDGTFRCGAPCAERALVAVVTADGFAAEAADLPPAGGEAAFVLGRPEARVAGRVVDAEGDGAHGARLLLRAEERPGVTVDAETDAGGDFVARHLFPGRWRVLVVRDPFTLPPSYEDLGVVEAPSEEVELRHPRAR